MAKFVPSDARPPKRLPLARKPRRDFLDTEETALSAAQDYADSLVTYKAGSDTIANTASTQAIAFATAFSDNNYAISIAADGDERVWITSKSASGFTVNRTGTTGDRVVYWQATPDRDP